MFLTFLVFHKLNDDWCVMHTCALATKQKHTSIYIFFFTKTLLKKGVYIYIYIYIYIYKVKKGRGRTTSDDKKAKR